MQPEREELVKAIFPRLRAVCAARDVDFVELDLRWGITDEEAQGGKVLPICLGEIDRCRPYFLGLLGERYGWVPDEIPATLLEEQSWLAEMPGRSVTELEIWHGVLNKPSDRPEAFFYFRDPSTTQGLLESDRAKFEERPTTEEIVRLGPAEAQRRAEVRRSKLAELKDRIRSSGFNARENYGTPAELGRWVESDLLAMIDRLFPGAGGDDPILRESNAQDGYAAAQARGFVGRGRELDRLDAHVEGAGPPLILTGEPGVGKSALLSAWARRYLLRAEGLDPMAPRRGVRRWFGGQGPSRRAAQAPPLVLHFVGATPTSTDWRALVPRLLAELSSRSDVPLEIPDRADRLRSALARALTAVAARRRVVIVLDGLDRLDDRDQAPDLYWLPESTPPGIRLIVSATYGRSFEALRRRGWPELNVGPLGRSDRGRMVEAYLGRYRKRLGKARVTEVVSARPSGSPLYLRTLLEELRVFGSHEALGDALTNYLKALTVGDLFGRTLTRLENDTRADRPGLVSEALGLIWAARAGLSEPELLALLGDPDTPMPPASWSTVSLALAGTLVSRSGLVGFAHDALREAVATRYLPTEPDRRAAHRRLAGYFAATGPTRRRLDERPWQLAEAGDWEELAGELADPTLLAAAWPNHRLDYQVFWARLERERGPSMAAAYRPWLDAPDAPERAIWAAAMLLDEAGHSADADLFAARAAVAAHHSGDPSRLQAALALRARAARAGNDLVRALILLREQEVCCRLGGLRTALAACFGAQGTVLRESGDLIGAEDCYAREEEICRELEDEAGLAACLGHRGAIARLRGRSEEALARFREQEAVARARGEPFELSDALGNQGVVLRDLGRRAEAERCHVEEEILCRRVGDQAGLFACLGHRATLAADSGDYDGALTLLDERLTLATGPLDDPVAGAWSLLQEVHLFADLLGRPRYALGRLEQARALASGRGVSALDGALESAEEVLRGRVD
jgi:tetratricopeptide (TPR) repeat protein